MAYPERLLTDDESVVTEFRPHWRLLVIPMAWLLLGIAIVVLMYTLDIGSRTVANAVTALVAVSAIPLAVVPFIKWWFTSYVLTTERLITRSGVIARSGIEIPLENISNVLFHQSMIERILRSGDLLIESAGESGQSRFENIPKPDEFQSTLYKVRELRTRALAREEGRLGEDATQKLERLARLHREGALSAEEYEGAKRALLDEL